MTIFKKEDLAANVRLFGDFFRAVQETKKKEKEKRGRRRFHCIDGVSTAILSQPPSNPRQEGCICYTKFIEPERNPAELKALASG